MKKANFHGIGDIRVEEVENRDPGPREVQVKIKYCGICGSDVHEYVHGPFPRSPFGHEACGEVVARGSEVTSLDIGDPVLAFGPGGRPPYPIDKIPTRNPTAATADVGWRKHCSLSGDLAV